jgi:hypothetical protein
MSALLQIIRPWVVLDVTSTKTGQTAGSSAASTPTSLAIGKTVSSSSNTQETTSGVYSYDTVCFCHAVVKEDKDKKPTGNKPQGKALGKGGTLGSGGGTVDDQGNARTDEDPNVKP